MSNIPTSPSFNITASDFTYVNGNQTNYNYGDLDRGARPFYGVPGSSGPQTQSQNPNGGNTRPEESPASPPPQSSTAYPQEPQPHPFQFPLNSFYQWNQNAPFDLPGYPNPAPPPTTNQPNHFPLPTPTQSPLSPSTSGYNIANATQSLSPDPSFSYPMPPNNFQATPAQARGQNNRRYGDRK